MERDNETWLNELRDGHPQQDQAIVDLLKYLKRGVMAYLRTRSDLHPLAETELEQMSQDFVQEAFLKIRTNLDKFQGRSKFTTWAAKIAGNHTISELRRAKWRDYSLDAINDSGTSLQEILAQPSNTGYNPATANERQQVWDTLNRVISTELTERQRQALVAVSVENVPISEVARLLNTNANNIYKLLHDARLKLKRRLQTLDLDAQYILMLFG